MLLSTYQTLYRTGFFCYAVMTSLHRMWKDHHLTLATNLRESEALVLSALFLLHTETWTLLSTDMKALEAFHMKCQHQRLGIRWSDFVSNVDVQAHIQVSRHAAVACRFVDTLPGLRVMFLRT